MKTAIRVSCVAAAGFALAAGSADADEGVVRDPPPTDGESGSSPLGEYGPADELYFAGDPTGGACFYETMGGDGIEIASELGFTVSEVYDGSCVADPGESNGLFDVVVLCSILNGADPCAGAEPDDFLRAPEGLGFAGVVLGSSFGRAQYVRQPCVTTIRGRPAHEYATGDGVTVAVLDTGIDRTHSLFNDPPERVLAGRDFVHPDEVPDEEEGRGYGHGTTVAGLVLLAAPDALILPVRVLDANGVGTAGRIAAGIRYATDSGAHVVNLSLGGIGRSSAIEDALADAMGRGVVVVAAAGNVRGSDALQFPASVPGVIAASGSAKRDGDVWTPAAGLAGPYPGERWFRGIGTSFSCALASGGVALAEQRWPGITGDAVVALLQPGATVRIQPFDVVMPAWLGALQPVRLNLLRLVR
jgi:hypothetical protein